MCFHLFGIGVITPNGDISTAGRSAVEPAIESISKAIALALHRGKPVSALVDAGAISSTGIVRDTEN